MQRQLIDYIRRPDSLDRQAVAQLRELVEKYPYYHAARILLLRALYQQHDPTFDAELRKTAILVPNRQALFHLIEEKNYQPKKEKPLSIAAKNRNEEAQDRTGNLIDDFLENLPAENTSKKVPLAEPTVDYLAYLQQTAQQLPMDNASTLDEEEDPIDIFLHKDNGKITLSEKPEDTLEKPQLVEENDNDNEIFTETLAHIYMKQGKFEQAIEIIRRLSLKYPKKNRYFADQIRFMEKIIINNKNK